MKFGFKLEDYIVFICEAVLITITVVATPSFQQFTQSISAYITK